MTKHLWMNRRPGLQCQGNMLQETEWAFAFILSMGFHTKQKDMMLETENMCDTNPVKIHMLHIVKSSPLGLHIK